MTPSEKLTLVQWNCHSLYNKLSHFKIFLYSRKPHIVCLSETWMNDQYEPNFINYNKYICNRTNSQGGGIAVLIRNDLINTGRDLNIFPNGKLEIQSVRIFSHGKTIDLLNIYNPNQVISTEQYDFYFQQMGETAIIVGDFNGHHSTGC